MLTLRVGSARLELSEVSPHLLAQAERRPGDWKITVYDAPPQELTNRGRMRTRIRRCMYGTEAYPYSVNFTEAEYSHIARTIYHGMRNEMKANLFHASLENAAQVLWSTGSLDDVTMRHLGVVFVMRYITNASGRGCCIPFLHQFKCMSREKQCELTRLTGVRPADQAGPRGGGGGGQGGNDDKKKKDDKKDEKPSSGSSSSSGSSAGGGGGSHFGSGAVLSPATPPTIDSAENAAAADPGNRTMTKDKVVAVLGTTFGEKTPEHVPVVGMLIGPCQRPPNVYSKNIKNLDAAIEERIKKKTREPTLTKEEMNRIGTMVRASMSAKEEVGVFSKKRIEEWAVKHFDMEACKSGKWTITRFKSSLENLYAKERPSFNFKADIKYECMEEGKAPRMLIADGDEGQLMALAVVKCFEELLFEHFEERSIKHLAKREAVERAVSALAKGGACAVEGDGSAWDTTCSLKIRNLVENPVLFHIMEILSEFGVIPTCWMEAHDEANKKKVLKLHFKNKFEAVKREIYSIRRSGHRGTSCLNWWVNFVLWVCSVMKRPDRYLNVKVRRGEDLTGVDRWWNGCFEGDDSLCTMFPPMKEGDDMSKEFLKFWTNAGFNMKIVFCKTRATFVGWHIACTDGVPNGVICPELPRAMANSGVSVSPEAIRAAETGNRMQANVLAAASALARSADFAGILPTVSWKYYQFANSCTTSNFQDREMSIRATGLEDHSAADVRKAIEEKNAGISPQQEMETLKALGYGCTWDELATFREYVWDMTPACLTNYDAFRASLPPSWRVDGPEGPQ